MLIKKWYKIKRINLILNKDWNIKIRIHGSEIQVALLNICKRN